MSFVWSVLASVTAAVFVAAVATLATPRFRRALTGLLCRLLDLDIESVYATQRKAADDVTRELSKTSQIRLLTGRGSELQRETFASALDRAQAGRVHFQVLLPDTSTAEGLRWIADREAETRAFDRTVGEGILAKQIDTTRQFIAAQSASVELRGYSFPHIGRILLTDRCAYLTPYSADLHGRDSVVYKYHRGGEHYAFLARIFDKLWTAAAPGQPPPAA